MNSQLPATDGRCIGFVGLGNMGQPIAACLLRSGFSLVVNDIIPTNANPLCDQGAQWVDDPRAIAHSCDIICTSLPGPDEFRDVFHSERGIVAGAQAGSTCIDFTTNSPSAVQEAGARLAAQGASLLDAPVSGGVERAQTGELTVLVGGADADFQRCKRVFDSVAESVLHVGALGTASICKILHNCAVFCTNLAMVECLTAGVKAGVDAQTLVNVFQQSGLGKNLDLHVALPATLLRGQFEPRYAMRTAAKDMALAAELADGVNVPMQLAKVCEADMLQAMRQGWKDLDHTIYLTLQEQRAGVQVRTSA